MLSDIKNKHPARKRELLLWHLIIPDLITMEKSGAYDRNVLLVLQNRYVEQAFVEFRSEIIRAGNAIGNDHAMLEALERYTREVYSASKARGDGIDLKGYCDAASMFFESEALRFGVQLNDVAEYIVKALSNGEKPDIERYARHCYISYSKMSGAMAKIENLNGDQASRPIAQYLGECIEKITFNSTGGPESEIGRSILLLTEKISQAPEQFIKFNDPSMIPMADRDPWSFEPMRRDAWDNDGVLP